MTLLKKYGIILDMTEITKTVRLRIAQWYAKNLLVIEPGYNVHLEKWNKEKNECTATFTCFSDYPIANFRKTKEDLEEYIVRRFGSMILEDKRKPSNLDPSVASKGVPLNHPLLKQDKKDYPSFSDNYSEEYILPLTKPQLDEANSCMLNGMRIKPDNIKKTSGYESDIYNLRIGKWQQ
jgi:hypothetical protein